MLNKEQFMDQYIVSGMATWAMMNEEKHRMNGDHKLLMNHYIIEDLIFLAYEAYKVYKNDDNQREYRQILTNGVP